MRKIMNAEILAQSMKLNQLEAQVTTINSKLCYIHFDVSGYQLEYVYNVNDKGNFFLERIKPYPLPLRVVDHEDAVVDIIEVDLEQFKSAIKSQNISTFINISKRMSETLAKFEDLFLYYNVPAEQADFIAQKLTEINNEIDKATHSAERLYFKKDPEHLNVNK
jgi:hypothetical protein